MKNVTPALLAVLLLAPWVALQAADETRPNIVLIVADDLGYNDVGCYGASLVKTPRIEALAGQGVRFTDAHSTGAFCIPSRYSSARSKVLSARRPRNPRCRLGCLGPGWDSSTATSMRKGRSGLTRRRNNCTI